MKNENRSGAAIKPIPAFRNFGIPQLDSRLEAVASLKSCATFQFSPLSLSLSLSLSHDRNNEDKSLSKDAN